MEHDYRIQHFSFMTELARRLGLVPALILEHSYTYEAFGSWWFSYKRAGRRFRIVFDGRDSCLSLDEGVTGTDRKRVVEWKSLGSRQVSDSTPDSLLSEIVSLVTKSK